MLYRQMARTEAMTLWPAAACNGTKHGKRGRRLFARLWRAAKAVWASEAVRQGWTLPHPSGARKMKELEAEDVGIQPLNSGRIAVEGVGEMEMHVDHQLHLVSIWLPNDEKDIAILEPVYGQYKGTKYRVAVFRSGREDLRSNTAKLLQFNK